MDPVSRVLEERRRLKPRWLRWAAVAFLLHAAVGATVILAARLSPRRVIHLPSVSVQLVRLPRRGPSRGTGPPPATPAPARPTPAPTARPRPTAAPPPGRPRRPRPSRSAMPAMHARATPEPTRPAAPAGGGLRLAGPEGAGQPAIPPDFHFTYYVERMLALIEARWFKPPAPPGTRTRVRFRILRDGHIVDIAIEESSSVPSFDRAALRALYAANPLPPLPPGYGPPSLTVHLAFTE